MPIRADKITTFNVTSGAIGMDKFCSFTYVNECGQEKCPVFEICTYKKRGQCMAVKGFLLAAYGPMERLMRKAKDPGIVSHWVGQLLSAYLKLAKFEIKEMSLRDPTYNTIKGDIKSHPIYDLLQKQQKLIVDLWLKSGMMDMAKRAGLMETDSLIPSMDDIVQPTDGQIGYYDAMLGTSSADEDEDDIVFDNGNDDGSWTGGGDDDDDDGGSRDDDGDGDGDNGDGDDSDYNDYDRI